MPHLSARFAGIILAFAPLFVQRTWQHAQVLLIGAILTPGRRTVASVLRITGRSRERSFVNYHRVLSRAAWDPRAGARPLLGLRFCQGSRHRPWPKPSIGPSLAEGGRGCGAWHVGRRR